MRPRPHVIVSAGEPSGDALAAGMIRELRALSPEVSISGIGGPAMRAAGAELIRDFAPLSVMGHWDALRNFPAILSLRGALLSHIRRVRPSLFVGVDAPDFNLGVAAAARKLGARTAQYVSPTVWMWRRDRVAGIARAADEVWCLFPFEPPFYAGSRATARFVGHPAADFPLLERDEARRRLGLELERRPVVALFPGSRAAELRRHLPLFAEALRGRDDLRVIAAAADASSAAAMRAGLAGVSADVCERPAGGAREIFAAADAALVKSGTAALEGALCLTPMAVVYRLGPMGEFLRRLFRFDLPFAALPNILAGRFAAPEFLLREASAGNLRVALGRILADESRRSRMREIFAGLRSVLARGGSRRAARAALEML